MSDLQQFSKDIDKAFAEKVVRQFVEFHKAVALDAFKKVSADTRQVGLAFGSPVWSGQFRHGHNLSLDAPDFTPPTPNPEVAEGLRWPDEPDNVLSPRPMSEAAMKLRILRPFSQVFITNAAPYARRLEGGYSKLKAPEGVYKVTAMAVIQKFKGAAFNIARGAA